LLLWSCIGIGGAGLFLSVSFLGAASLFVRISVARFAFLRTLNRRVMLCNRLTLFDVGPEDFVQECVLALAHNLNWPILHL
jgi:hypothetical protein